MIDIKAAREAYEKANINFFKWIETRLNLADGFTKLALNQNLKEFMANQKLCLTVRTLTNRRRKFVTLGSSNDDVSAKLKTGECGTDSSCHPTDHTSSLTGA